MHESLASDRGTTLTEVLVVMALSAVVVPALYLAVVAGFRQDQAQEVTQAAEVRVRHISGRLSDDIRESWPSDQHAGDPAQELVLEHLNSGGSLVRVTWVVVGDALVRRETMAVSGATISNEEVLTDFSVAQPFQYWTDQGTEISGQSIARCAVRVTISLGTVANGGDASTSFDIAHRIRDPEVAPC